MLATRPSSLRPGGGKREHDPFDGKLAHEAMAMVGVEEKLAYLQAVRVCPTVVQRESSHDLFLRFCGFDMWHAGRRLAKYWYMRLDLFGAKAAFLPLPEALQKHHKLDWRQIENQATPLALPPDTNGNAVIYFDRSPKIPEEGAASVSSRCRIFWFMAQLALLYDCDTTLHGRNILYLVQVKLESENSNLSSAVSSYFDAEVDDFMRRAYRDALCGAPIHVHFCFVNPPVKSSKSFSRMPKIMAQRPRDLSNSKKKLPFSLHAGTPAQVLASLKAKGFAPEATPESLGGSLSVDAHREALLASNANFVFQDAVGENAIGVDNDVSQVLTSDSDSLSCRDEELRLSQVKKSNLPLLLEDDPPLQEENIEPHPGGEEKDSTNQLLNDVGAPRSELAMRPFWGSGAANNAAMRTCRSADENLLAEQHYLWCDAEKAEGVYETQTVCAFPTGKRQAPTGTQSPDHSRIFNMFDFLDEIDIARVKRERRSLMQPSARPPGSPNSDVDNVICNFAGDDEKQDLLGPSSIYSGIELIVDPRDEGFLCRGGIAASQLPLSAEDPFQGDLVHDAMLFVADNQSYMKAVKLSPELIRAESPHARFLNYTKGDIWTAAQRLADYWTIREEVFGSKDAFLPFRESLTDFNWAAVCFYNVVILPRDSHDRPVYYQDGTLRFSSSLHLLNREMRRRSVFVFMQLCCNEAVAKGEVVVLLRVDPFGAQEQECDKVGLALIHRIMTAMCIHVKELHFVLCVEKMSYARTSPLWMLMRLAVAGFRKICPFFDILKPFFHVGSKHDVAKSLTDCGLFQSALPTSIGGMWQVESQWPAYLASTELFRGRRPLYFPEHAAKIGKF